MSRIACLHTAESNIDVFDTALREAGLSGVDLHHMVRADLLAAAEAAGGLTTAIAARAAETLRHLARQADAVVLTCSTLGPVADDAAASSSTPILRVDSALADAAVRGGGTIVVLCAVETTLEPTRLLFERAAAGTGASIDVRLVPGAWALFQTGERDRYLAVIARAAEAAACDGASKIVLAQASMAGATTLCVTDLPVMSSPVAGLLAAVAIATGLRHSRPASTS